MTGPLVSVIIPTYNYVRYIGRALASLASQDYEPLEIIVVDDGSTDDTAGVVARSGLDVIYVRQENRGVSAARNAGLALSTGAFIAFLDADDYLLDRAVSMRVEVLLRRPDIGVVFCDTCAADADGKLHYRRKAAADIESDRFYEDLLLRHLRFQTSAAMVRADVAKRFFFPVGMANGEDLVYFAKVFFAVKGYFIAKAAVANLHHEDSLRHDLDEVVRQDISFVAAILDDPYYAGALEYMRKELTSKRHLELFRRLYLSGQPRQARSHYAKAVALRPASLFRLSYLSKALRSFFRRG
jgi:glycosyltransferase involved in cell wall biosynthesis